VHPWAKTPSSSEGRPRLHSAQARTGFGKAVKPQVRALRDAQAQALEALVNRRRQLVEMLTAEKNRRANSPKVIHKGIDEHIRWLEKRLSGLDELAGLVCETPIWRERDVRVANC
jgi:transposase